MLHSSLFVHNHWGGHPREVHRIGRIGHAVALALLVGLFIADPVSVAATPPPIQSACEIDYPPFCIVDEDGRADGFSVELLRAALQKMGREVTFRTGPWVEVRGWLERGEVDALPLVGRTPEREELFDFTVPYLTMSGAIVVRDNTDDIHSLADLQGRRVGVMEGDNAEEFLRREERDFEVIITAPTFSDAFHDLAEGRSDAVIIQRLVAIRLLEETGLTNLKIVDRPVGEFSQDFCFAVREGDRVTLSVLNEGLALAVADGTHRHLYAKWFAHLELPTNRPIVVGGDDNYPPFEFLDEKGRPAGFTVELTRAIAREMNMDVRIELGPWKDRVKALREGRIDALQGLFYTLERDHVFDFSPKYLIIHCVSVVRKGEGPPPTTIEELQGRDLVIQAEDAILDLFAERGIEANVTTVESQEDVVRAVAEGRSTLGLATRFGALCAIRKNGWTNIDLGGRAIYSGQYSYAVSKGHGALQAQFTEGLQILKDSAKYQSIYERWLGTYEPGVSMRTVLKYLAGIAVPLLVVALLALLWSWSLKKEVTARTQELRESLDRFQTMFMAANVGKSMTLPSGKLNVNRAFADMLGYAPEELRDKTWQELTPSEDIPQVESHLAPLLAGQKDSTRFEKRYVRKDGGTVWADVSETLLRDTQGRPLHFITTVVDITEHKQAAQALHESEARYRRLFESAKDGILILDAETGKVVDVNPYLLQLLGHDRAVIMGLPLWDIGPFRDIAESRETFSVLQEEEYVRYEDLPLQSATGRVVDVEFVSNVYLVNGLKVIQCNIRDITARKRAESRIRHLNRVLRAIRDINQLITHETDRAALLRQSCEILVKARGYRSAWAALRGADGGIDAAEQCGIDEGFDVLRQDLERGEWPDCCQRALELPAGVATVLEASVNCKTCVLSRNHNDTAVLAGRLLHAELDYGVMVVSLPQQLADDEEEQSLFRALIGDIAYALHTMETAKERREGEVRFRSYVEHAPYGIFIADRSGRYLDVNPAASEITGYSEDELLTMATVDLLLPEGRESGQALFQKMIEVGRVSAEMPFVCKSGEVRHWTLSGVALSDERFMGFTQDITQRKESEQEQEELQTQLIQAQKMQSVGRLAGGVAHDFNNILQTMMGYSAMLLDALSEDNKLYEFAEEIMKAAERAAALTRQLLAFARKQTISPRVIDLNETVESMLKMLRRLIGEDIDLHYQPHADLWPTKMDPGQIDQILANLCVNARDAISGVGKVTIETKKVTFDKEYCDSHASFTPGDFVMLAVNDDGPGMDKETIENIFEPFFTTKGLGEGTGLGLSTVYGIVKQNDGFINVYSEPGEGTSFKIYLPRHAAEAASDYALPEASIQYGHGETVLMVEDDLATLKLNTRMLDELNYQVHSASTPNEALALTAEHADDFQLLITDVVMPEMNGRDLANQVQARCPQIRILFVSGYTADVIAHRGVLDEGTNFLEKPFSRAQLATKVREILET